MSDWNSSTFCYAFMNVFIYIFVKSCCMEWEKETCTSVRFWNKLTFWITELNWIWITSEFFYMSMLKKLIRSSFPFSIFYNAFSWPCVFTVPLFFLSFHLFRFDLVSSLLFPLHFFAFPSASFQSFSISVSFQIFFLFFYFSISLHTCSFFSILISVFFRFLFL